LGSHGDVHARAFVRFIEMTRSVKMCLDILKSYSPGELLRPCPPPGPGMVGLALVEAWRGELVSLKVTDSMGLVVAAQVVDPSVHNWFGLAFALRGQGISDFPLCNKSFNLAYAGHDL